MRYLVGFFITVGLVILLIIMLFSGNNSSSTQKTTTTGKALTSYASTDAEVRLTIDGPVVADQDHRQLLITVDKNSADIELTSGYNGNVISSQNFANSEDSYSTFLRSLELIGFNKGDTTSAYKDETGHCPLGRRYIFELIQDNKTIQRFWASSCGGKIRTYNGDVDTTLYLFKKQIPQYQNLVSSNDYSGF